MRNKSNAKHLEKIVAIRQLEKERAKQDLVQAKLKEEDRDFFKNKTENALSKSLADWQENLDSTSILPEYLPHYFNNLNESATKYSTAKKEYNIAVDLVEAKNTVLSHSDVLLRKTSDIHEKLKRKIVKEKDEREMRKCEDRFSYAWSCKS